MTVPADLIGAVSGAELDRLYQQYRDDPDSLPADWRAYLESVTAGDGAEPSLGSNGVPASRSEALLQDRLDQLVRAYRARGHLAAQIDPLHRERERPAELDPARYGFTAEDYDRLLSCDTLPGPSKRTLGQVLELLEETYCRSVGAELTHIDDVEVRRWLEHQMERSRNRGRLDATEQRHVLERLTHAVLLEEFIRTKFLGAKSFSLEGAETLLPLIDLAIERAGEQSIDEIVIGMPHRGRLNVLVNLLGKSAQTMFGAFAHPDASPHQGGDVKYHLGASTDFVTRGGKTLHLSLCFNPSHLEFVGPVALGRTRAKQDRFGDRERRRCMTLLIHGDAAFAGEGVVQETLQLSGLPSYTGGGVLHVIVNNQIGFTTTPDEGRATRYATDIAKMLQVPIFHVNGEDPEAVAQVVRMAMDFRQRFERDAVIDMYCYRRLGHNEMDDPTYTQPRMYQAIEKRETVRESWVERLIELGTLGADEADEMAARVKERLESDLAQVRENGAAKPKETSSDVWQDYVGGPWQNAEPVSTGVDPERLTELLRAQTRLPEGFTPHRRFEKFFERRQEMASGNRPLDWAAAESLAFASLATDGVPIRMSGQDSVRGTFGQRHAVLCDQRSDEQYMPLAHLSAAQAEVIIVNSPLNETGVLGFEYGYSLDRPDALVIWEAQYGDFVNAAQVVIDQFIASAEEKWRRLSGLVLLLPHGLEGQGPEHSSARLERFLGLAARDNMLITVPSTPAQYFHLLRRQGLWHWRKPLIIFTPKSLLRDPRCTAELPELAHGPFCPILDDRGLADRGAARKLVACSGKVYYDLLAAREERQLVDVALLRIEQLYPFPRQDLTDILELYPPDLPLTWVQEEPENMGAWPQLRLIADGGPLCGRRLDGIYRPPSASPATGSASAHKREQQLLIDAALS